MQRRLAAAAVAGVALVAVAAGLAAAGRWEARHAQAATQRGIDQVRATVGRELGASQLYGPQLMGQQLTALAQVLGLTCLLYASGSYVYSYELCYDGEGRLIDAVDATQAEARYWSLRPYPGTARERITPADLSAVQAYLDRREGLRAVAGFVKGAWLYCSTSVRDALAATPGTAARMRGAAASCRSWAPGVAEVGRFAAERFGAPAEARNVERVYAAMLAAGDAAASSAPAPLRAALAAGSRSAAAAGSALEQKARLIRSA